MKWSMLRVIVLSFTSIPPQGIRNWLRPSPLPVLLLAIVLSPVVGYGADWSLNGYFKSQDLRIQETPGAEVRAGGASANRFRLDLAGSIPSGLRGELAAESLFLYTDPQGIVPLPGSSPNRLVDLKTDWNRDDHLAGQLAVDRLNLRGNFAGWDWTAGRQAIGFGRIVLFSPLDVIAPFPPEALDTDVRPGVDALRLVRYFGLGGQAGIASVFSDDRKDDSYLGTFSWNISKWDLLLLTGSLRQRAMVGVGLAGALGGLGVKGEASVYKGKDVGDPGGDLRQTFTIAGLELWYRFDVAGNLVLLAEYLYNGAGVNHPDEYPRAAASAPYQEGLSFLLGRHYLLVGPSYELHSLVNLQGLLILNLKDESWFFRPLVDISLSEDIFLQLFWNFSVGENPREIYGLTVPRSEFGSAPDSGGLLLKFFF